VRATTLATLYASPLVYAYFGYEGEAFSKGGYLMRGFNDLRWLPEVPLAGQRAGIRRGFELTRTLQARERSG
jgi:hypothetical protein